jgi:hypothetical protein
VMLRLGMRLLGPVGHGAVPTHGSALTPSCLAYVPVSTQRELWFDHSCWR